MQTQLLSANVFMFGPVHCFYALFTSVLDLVGRKSGRRGKAKQIKKKKKILGQFLYSLTNLCTAWKTKRNLICSSSGNHLSSIVQI